jgi:ABC-type sugar transport system ATPase subunit
MPLLQATNISKRFLGVAALKEVSFTVNAGEVHALLGENGAGKSTFLKILAGAHAQDSGMVEFDGQPLGLQTPAERQRQGIVTVYQEFNLMPNMSVAENVFIGREPGPGYFVDRNAMRRAAISAISRLDLHVDPATPVSALSVAEQQLVEIARALTINAKLIILDEPTAALSDREVQKLHAVVRDLKSHRISGVRRNLTLPSLKQLCRFRYFGDRNAETALIRQFKQDLRIRMANEDVIVGTLSGGNQQKVVLARYLALKPKILFVDEPTRGIDVGAKAEVHDLLRQLAEGGTAIVVVSSELPEIISLCDRIITVKEGRFTGEMAAADATEEKLMKLMTLGAGETHVHHPII